MADFTKLITSLDGKCLSFPFLVLGIEEMGRNHCLVVTELTEFNCHVNMLRNLELMNYQLDPERNVTIPMSQAFLIWLFKGSYDLDRFARDYAATYGEKFDLAAFQQDFVSCTAYKKQHIFAMCQVVVKNGKFGYEGILKGLTLIHPSRMHEHASQFKPIFNRLLEKCDYTWLMQRKNPLSLYIKTMLDRDSAKPIEAPSRSKSNKAKARQETKFDPVPKKRKPDELAHREIFFPDPSPGALNSLLAAPVASLTRPSKKPNSQDRYSDSHDEGIFANSQEYFDRLESSPVDDSVTVTQLVPMNLSSIDKVLVKCHILYIDSNDSVTEFGSRGKSQSRAYRQNNIFVYKSLDEPFIQRMKLVLSDTKTLGNAKVSVEFDNIKKMCDFLGVTYPVNDDVDREGLNQEVADRLHKLVSQEEKYRFYISNRATETPLGFKKYKWVYNDNQNIVDLLTSI